MVKTQVRVILMADLDGDEVIPEERGVIVAERGEWIKVLVDRCYRNHKDVNRDDGTRFVKWDRAVKEEA